MNFNEALQAHQDWQEMLHDYLQNPDGSLRSEEIRSDHFCPLGHWLVVEGLIYGELPEYVDLTTKHQVFHICAAAVVAMASSPGGVSLDAALGPKSAFKKASDETIAAIIAFEKKILSLK